VVRCDRDRFRPPVRPGGVTPLNAVNATETEPRLPAGLPDGWLLDQDLPCPQCRYNLRMLSTPRCPECGTVFRWQTLLHIACPRCGESLETIDDPRCPRCDLDLNWQALLDQADPSQFKQFEYTQRPVRAAIRTWFATLRPRRFWHDIRLESPPAPKRLRRLLAAAITVYILAIAVAFESNRYFWPGSTFDASCRTFCEVAILMPIVTMVGLPLFVPTMARFRIRRDQLWRCFAYGATGLIWIGCAFLLAAALTILVNILWPITWTTWAGTSQQPRLTIYPDIVADWLRNSATGPWDDWSVRLNGFLLTVMLYFSLVWWWPFLWTALHRYLRLNRRNALALFASTQLTGLIAIAIILVRYTTFGIVVGSLLNRIIR
jgi:hypothetical protein